MINPSNAIVWIQLRLVGLIMLSEGLHLAFLRPTLSVMRFQIAVSEDLKIAHNR